MNYGPTREEKKRFLSPPLQQFLNEYDKHYAIDEMSVLPRDYVNERPRNRIISGVS